MSEFDIINRTKDPVTLKSLAQDFRNLGIEKGDIILVHSSLSSIGWVCGEERTVIEALIDAVGPEGTICMPAHSGGNSDPTEWRNPPVPQEWIDCIYQNMPPFDPDITPTRGIGRIPEAFRTYPGALRSYHPQTSFCAYGKYAQDITLNHVLTPQFGMETPLGRLYKLNAKVLFIGTGYDTSTCFHMGEVLCNCTPRMKLGAALRTEKGREWVWFEDFNYDCDDFDHLGMDFENTCEVRNGMIGYAHSKLFRIKSAVDFAAEWLKTNRN
jgi:aminoglycoside 3-N-acetyltransferase